MYEIPAYLVWGFLESGKSTLIKETLNQDYFNDGEKTMILTFEEGEVEYDKEMAALPHSKIRGLLPYLLQPGSYPVCIHQFVRSIPDYSLQTVHNADLLTYR